MCRGSLASSKGENVCLNGTRERRILRFSQRRCKPLSRGQLYSSIHPSFLPFILLPFQPLYHPMAPSLLFFLPFIHLAYQSYLLSSIYTPILSPFLSSVHIMFNPYTYPFTISFIHLSFHPSFQLYKYPFILPFVQTPTFSLFLSSKHSTHILSPFVSSICLSFHPFFRL